MSDWKPLTRATCVDDNGEKYPYTEDIDCCKDNELFHRIRKRWHYPDWKGIRREEIWKIGDWKDRTKEALEAREWDRNGKLISEIKSKQ